MNLLQYVPQQPLGDFVELLWYLEGSAPSHARERVLPTGTMQLVINLRDDTLRVYGRQGKDRPEDHRGSLISGTYSEYFVIDTAAQASIMGVHFRPGGAFPFLGLPAGELSNLHLSLDTLWGADADELRYRLLETTAPSTKFGVLEQFLLAQATRPLVRHPAVAFALREFQVVPQVRTVADVTKHIGLSARRFIHVFRDEVGLTPKRFCRVRRFQEALHVIGRSRQIEWPELALACGYFDQAHFIHDFRAFSGLTPTAYCAQRSEYQNHVPLAE